VEVALSEISSMCIDIWKPVTDDLHSLFLQGWATGARVDLVGLIVLLLAKYCAINCQRGIYIYLYLRGGSIDAVLGETVRCEECEECSFYWEGF